MSELSVVTGALGYTGRYIAGALFERGERVRTLTAHPARSNPFGDRLEIAPLDFAAPERLARSLEGASTLYNTYWIRFPWRGATFDTAVANSCALIEAARIAGVRRIVHISITSANPGSPLPYFRGKGMVERAILDCGIPYLILRPTLIFGAEDILINNIAWMLRRFPVFAIPGRGDYRVQPVFVGDIAALAVGAESAAPGRIMDAVGPETYMFSELVRTIAAGIGRRPRLVSVPPGVMLALASLFGRVLGDVTLTRDEVGGLMAGLLVSRDPPACPTALSAWLRSNSGQVGKSYRSELTVRSEGKGPFGPGGRV